MNQTTRKLRTVFMGTSSFALPTMKALAASETVIAVVTQPDRPQGRGNKVLPPPAKECALTLGLTVWQPERVKEPHFIEQLRAVEPELIVVAAFGQILPPAILAVPPQGCINVHPSLLPRYRGAAPINWAVIRGETKTGVTTYFMDKGMDTGAILLAREVEIKATETAEELGTRLAVIGAELLIETIQGVKQGGLPTRPQDEGEVSYAPILKKQDGLIRWEEGADQIRNQIRGLVPWPVAYTWWAGKRLKVYQGKVGASSGSPGEIVSLNTGIEVACGTGSLIIETLQLEGGKRVGWAEFVRGHRLTPAERLG
jgi:methionyl-tRNA formyltransferase